MVASRELYTSLNSSAKEGGLAAIGYVLLPELKLVNRMFERFGQRNQGNPKRE